MNGQLLITYAVEHHLTTPTLAPYDDSDFNEQTTTASDFQSSHPRTTNVSDTEGDNVHFVRLDSYLTTNPSNYYCQVMLQRSFQ